MARREHDGWSLERAQRLAHDLVDRLLRDLIEIEAGGGDRDPAHTAQLEQAELPSIVLLAALKLRTGPRAVADAAMAIERTESLVGEIDRAELRRKLETAGPGELVERYVNQQRQISPRTRYNLACYYTTLGKQVPASARIACYDRALADLDLALETGGLVAWAQADPSLEPLEAARPTDFAELLARHRPAPHPTKDEAEPAADEDGEEDDAARKAATSRRRNRREEDMARHFFRWLERETNERLTRLKPTGTHPGFDFAVFGDDERVFVDVRASDDPIGPDVIERLLTARRAWSETAPDQPVRLALVIGHATVVAPDAAQLASRSEVEIYVVGPRGAVRRLGAAR